ncbi:MAG: CPBP family intramembrane metalloprotease [Vallitaleaceae bacterium]|nr:CPBP family intramembrane metalloprotease [Vallitaleaceae bacterium]
MKYINKLDTYLRSLPTAKFILIMTLISFLIVVPLDLMAFFINIDMNGPDFYETPIVLSFLSLGIIVPIFETLIFQFLIIRFLKKFIFFKNRIYITILISAVLFGLSHTYSIAYVFFAFIIGLLLAYAFVIYEDKKASAFWVTMAIHGLRNILSVAIKAIESLY